MPTPTGQQDACAENPEVEGGPDRRFRHRELALHADAVVVLAAGTIRFDGTVEEFRSLAGDPDSSAAMAQAYARVVARSGW